MTERRTGQGHPRASLASRIYASFDGNGGRSGLDSLCASLLSEQKEAWADCREGHESLDDVKVRTLLCAGFSVRIQHNRGRMRSTTAAVEEKVISERPCFLCVSNLAPSQKGVLYRNGYLILCNPMPVFHPHFTVCNLDHRPQAVEDNIQTLLQLAGDFGGSWTVLYNGPRCGASAPDHLHFQVIASGQMPVEDEIEEAGRLMPAAKRDGSRLFRVGNMGREALLIEGDSPLTVSRVFRDLARALRKVLHSYDEPMMSVAGFLRGRLWRLLVFPRAKHRPEAFFMEGDARLVVSPAVIEMGGVIVAPREKDFDRLNQSHVEGIYGEVSLDGGTVKEVIRAMAECDAAPQNLPRISPQ
ncbi:MAG: DUF4922 domain-containing protein [Syntrophobacterales bacterium]|jgi:hypothetical protein|nr:DUF4922 domain-containing protein [Syntrophobacterales bacterium]